MKPEVTLIAHLLAKPEKRAELLEILTGFVKPTRADKASVVYNLHVSKDNPNSFVFYECWRTQKELDEHFKVPFLANFWARRLDYLQKDAEVEFVTMLSDL